MILVEQAMKMAKSLGHPSYSAKYGIVDVDSGSLRLRKKPVITENYDGLKDIKYTIYDGALYITATRSRWYYVAWGSSLDCRGRYYKISQERFDGLNVPEDCVVRNKRWGLFRRKHKIVIDTVKNPFGNWVERKDESKFNMALHPYKIVE